MFLDVNEGDIHPVKRDYVFLGAWSVPEVYVVSSFLTANGIDHFIEGEAVGEALGLTIGPMGEKMIYVKNDDYDLALNLLKEVESSDNSDSRR